MAKKERKVGATASSQSGKPKHSLDSNRGSKGDLGKRDAATVRRLQMYKKRAVRDKNGKLLYQEYQSSDLPTTRIQPDRRWFGNTRVIGQKQLEQFRTEMSSKVNDAYTVLLREKKLPLQLLEDPDKKKSGKEARVNILNSFSFSDTFGPNRKRKRPKLMVDSLDEFAQTAEKKEETFEAKPVSAPTTLAEELKDQVKDSLFEKGQSKRIWGELYKVLDSSDVVIQVLDARDPEGTRCRFLEHHIRTNARHKHLLFLLNKCDLVPAWVTKRWLHHLSREFPTLAFHASITNPFGKGSLLSLLRQLARLRSDKQAISVGFVGYPNVGKSSVINTLRTKKVCKTAPVPGETKVWQYITLMKRIFLIDCPGVVYNKTSDSQTEAVLKGVVRVENLQDAAEHVKEVLARVKPEYLKRAYKISSWSSSEDFLEQLARLSGKLHRGGEPDLNTAAKMVLYDWQRGKIPFFTLPPDHTEAAPAAAAAAEEDVAVPAVAAVPQNAVTEEDAQTEAGARPEMAAAAAKAVLEGVQQAAKQQQRSSIPQQEGYFLPADALGDGEDAAAAEDDDVIGSDVISEDSEDGEVSSDEEAAADAAAGSTEEQEEEQQQRKKGRRRAAAQQQQQQEEDGSGDESDGYGEGGLSFEAVMAMMQGGAAEEAADAEASQEEPAQQQQQQQPERQRARKKRRVEPAAAEPQQQGSKSGKKKKGKKAKGSMQTLE